MKTTGIRLIVVLSAMLLGAACGDGSPGDNENDNQTPLIGVPGVTITEVSVYQGPKCTIMSGGVAQVCDVPLINGRDALVRVFYSAIPAAVGQTVTAMLTIDAEHSYEQNLILTAGSSEADMASTVNFVVPGEAINQFLSYQVAIVQAGAQSNDNPAARFPSQGQQPVAVDGLINTFRVILAPFAYCADGSCRVPNLDAAHVEGYRQRLLQLYPVTNVEVSVRDAHDWNQVISPNGDGWQQVGVTLMSFRSADGESADVYYYGIFNPAASFDSFCGMGCLLGVTLLNDDGTPDGDPMFRFALGVGFEGWGEDTAAHELGHAHGLEHVNCGVGIDPNSIDHNYPYNSNSIGVWSWDIVSETLIDPDSKTDIMGYCENQWISDYHYNKLYDRGSHVNLPRWHVPAPTIAYQVVAVDGRGGGTIHDAVTRASHTLRGQRVPVLAHTPDGSRTVTGQYFRWDHLPGGFVFVPVADQPMERAELTMGGIRIIAERQALQN